jgi:hypothetical protein
LRRLRHVKAMPGRDRGTARRMSALAICVAAEQKERERATP